MGNDCMSNQNMKTVFKISKDGYLYYEDVKGNPKVVADFGLECVKDFIDKEENCTVKYVYKIISRASSGDTITISETGQITKKFINDNLKFLYNVIDIDKFKEYVAQQTKVYFENKNVINKYNSDSGLKKRNTTNDDIKIAENFLKRLNKLIKDENKMKKYITLNKYNENYIGFLEEDVLSENQFIVISAIKMLGVLYPKKVNEVSNINYISSLYRGLKILKAVKLNSKDEVVYPISYFNVTRGYKTTIKMMKIIKKQMMNLCEENNYVKIESYKKTIEELQEYVNSKTNMPIKLYLKSNVEEHYICLNAKDESYKNGFLYIEDCGDIIKDNSRAIKCSVEELVNINGDNLQQMLGDEIRSAYSPPDNGCGLVIKNPSMENVMELLKKKLKLIAKIDNTKCFCLTLHYHVFEQNNYTNEPTMWTTYNDGKYYNPSFNSSRSLHASDYDYLDYTNENNGSLYSEVLSLYEKKYIKNLFGLDSVRIDYEIKGTEYGRMSYYDWLDAIYQTVHCSLKGYLDKKMNIYALNIVHSILGCITEMKKSLREEQHIELINRCDLMVKCNIIFSIFKIKDVLKIKPDTRSLADKSLAYLTNSQLRYLLDMYISYYKWYRYRKDKYNFEFNKHIYKNVLDINQMLQSYLD